MPIKKFEEIKIQFMAMGTREDNIDFAIEALKDGVRREHILESLTADYRGMTTADSTRLLDKLYAANGGEFRKESQDGYLTGILLCIIGAAGLFFLVSMLITGEIKIKLMALAFIATMFGLVKGPIMLIKSYQGKYRLEDDPF